MTFFPSPRPLPGLLAILLLPLPAAAQAPEVRITVMAIHATERNKDVDEDLKDIADRVQKAEPKLTGFRKGRVTSLTVAAGGKESFSLADDEVATVTFEGIDKKEKVKLTVKLPTLGAFTYATAYDRFFPVVTRYETKSKDRLIVAIMVESKGK